MAGQIRMIKGLFKAVAGIATCEGTMLIDGVKDLAIGGALSITGSVIGDAIDGTAVGDFIENLTGLDL